MKKTLGIIYILLVTVISAYAQVSEEDSLLNSFLDELMADDEAKNLNQLIDIPKNYHFLYFNTSASNKTMYAGREVGNNASNYSGQLYYFISNGLYLGASGVYYQDFTPHYQSTPIILGYSSGKDNIRYRTSYTRYFYHIPDYDPLFQNSINTGISYNIKPFGIRSDYTLMFGEETDSRLSLDAYVNINLMKMKRYNKLTLEPQVSFDFGTETVESEIIIDPDLPPIYDNDKVFGLMNIQLNAPLFLSVGDFLWGIEYTYNITRSLDPEYSYSNSHQVSISLGYIIGLN